MIESFILFFLLMLICLHWLASVQMQIMFIVLSIVCIPEVWLLTKGSAPFVPSGGKMVRKMMDIAGIRNGDLVYDLGCGDGRIVFAAAKCGAKATGLELSIPTYVVAKVRSWFHRDSTILYKNFWKQDYRNADVIFCYLMPNVMVEFEKTVWPTLKSGCRVVSNAFSIKNLEATKKDGGVYLYVKGG